MILRNDVKSTRRKVRHERQLVECRISSQEYDPDRILLRIALAEKQGMKCVPINK